MMSAEKSLEMAVEKGRDQERRYRAYRYYRIWTRLY